MIIGLNTGVPVDNFTEETQLIDVKCGYGHVLCLLEDGNCLSWGNGMYGQLGHEEWRLPLH
jgi:alpha-tubulin suppressor-like RCC1 family protein